MKVLKSEIDESVNFVIPYGEGVIEARYVRRQPDYFICYLSSQTGCNKGCAMCHLTTTKQTSFEQVSWKAYVDQANAILSHYKDQVPAKVINYNWMSRGEALSNPEITQDWYALSQGLIDLTRKFDAGLDIRFNISTIMPKTFRGSLARCFREGAYPTIYYSLYSMDQEWKDKWMPGAKPSYEALDILKAYQDLTQKIVYIHGPFIKGENDSWEDVDCMINAIQSRNLMVKWNIVRYNPFSPEEGEESDNLEYLTNQLSNAFGASNVQIVSRVGRDVQASCGTFVSGELYE